MWNFQGDGSKATFTLHCEDRVDFRQLIKGHGQSVGIRIEMRQIVIGKKPHGFGRNWLLVAGNCAAAKWLTDF